MEHILIVAGTTQGVAMLQQLLHEQGLEVACSTDNGLDARRQLEARSFDLVVVNSPLPDEHGEAVARLAWQKQADVILLVKQEHADAVYERIGKTGIYMIPKPLKKAVFFQILQCIRTHNARLAAVREEKDRLAAQIQEAKLLNRAKLLLMQVLKLSEPQAHHYIEKQAMDLRISKLDVAKGIINTYEN